MPVAPTSPIAERRWPLRGPKSRKRYRTFLHVGFLPYNQVNFFDFLKLTQLEGGVAHVSISYIDEKR